MKKILNEFKEFSLRGNFVDIAVGIFIGAGLSSVASSLIKDIVMPVIGALTGSIDFSNKFILLKEGSLSPPPYLSADLAKKAGAVVMSYGMFLNAVFNFMITSWFAFLAVKGINKLKRLSESEIEVVEDASTKACKFCLSTIPIKASHCAYCTSIQPP